MCFQRFSNHTLSEWAPVAQFLLWWAPLPFGIGWTITEWDQIGTFSWFSLSLLVLFQSWTYCQVPISIFTGTWEVLLPVCHSAFSTFEPSKATMSKSKYSSSKSHIYFFSFFSFYRLEKYKKPAFVFLVVLIIGTTVAMFLKPLPGCNDGSCERVC